jgi:paraquat-inducible protein B
MKTWARGRKKATPEQKQRAKEWQRIRVKITNAVSRDKELNRKCCICGKEDSPILHNRENPTYITFLCTECRKDKEKVKQAEQYRFDLKEHKEQQVENRDTNRYLDTRKFSKEEVKSIVEGYTASANIQTYGEYCEKNNLSRHQFNALLERYKEYFPRNKGMIDKVHNRSKAIQRNKLSGAANDRNLQLQNETRE